MTYIKPKVFGKAFNCPHSACGVLAKQDWKSRTLTFGEYPNREQNPLRIAVCQLCGKASIWVEDKMYFPIATTAPKPNTEMPSAVLKLYQEAALIAEQSPMGAGALLRLSIQVLCIELGQEGKDLNKDIGQLVKNGLPKIVQESLDVVRVTGNESVHPGEIDTDDPVTVESLFKLVNIIVEYMIAMPKQVSGLFNGLPEGKRKGINDRDKPKP